MKRIVILSFLFGLNSCLLLWDEALEKEETQSGQDQALALAALSSPPVPQPVPSTPQPSPSCTAPTESVGIEMIVPAQGGNLMFQVSGSVSTATHYYFYGRLAQSPDWTLFTSISAADFDSFAGLIYIPDPGLDEYMVRAVSNGCLGPPSDIYVPLG